jgi:hypothetical protein
MVVPRGPRGRSRGDRGRPTTGVTAVRISTVSAAMTTTPGGMGTGTMAGTAAASTGGGSAGASGTSTLSRSIPIRTPTRRRSSRCCRLRYPLRRRRPTGITATIRRDTTHTWRNASHPGERFRRCLEPRPAQRIAGATPEVAAGGSAHFSASWLLAVLCFGAGLARMRTLRPSCRSTSKAPVFRTRSLSFA